MSSLIEGLKTQHMLRPALQVPEGQASLKDPHH
jgi:hypothetical protein